MASSMLDDARYNRLRRNFWIFLISCVAFSTVIYMPVYWLMYSNIRWSESTPMLIWTEMLEPVMNYIFYLGSFSFLIHGSARFGARRVAPFIGIFTIAAFLRYFTNVFSYIWIMGALHLSEWATYDLPAILFSAAVDCVQIGIAYWICTHVERQKAYTPVARVTERSPMTLAAWFCAIIPVTTQVLSRIYYDIQLAVSYELKIEGTWEILVMVSYYLTDLLTIPVGFVVIAQVLKWLGKAEARAQAEWDAAKKK